MALKLARRFRYLRAKKPIFIPFDEKQCLYCKAVAAKNLARAKLLVHDVEKAFNTAIKQRCSIHVRVYLMRKMSSFSLYSSDSSSLSPSRSPSFSSSTSPFPSSSPLPSPSSSPFSSPSPSLSSSHALSSPLHSPIHVPKRIFKVVRHNGVVGVTVGYSANNRTVKLDMTIYPDGRILTKFGSGIAELDPNFLTLLTRDELSAIFS